MFDTKKNLCCILCSNFSLFFGEKHAKVTPSNGVCLLSSCCSHSSKYKAVLPPFPKFGNFEEREWFRNSLRSSGIFRSNIYIQISTTTPSFPVSCPFTLLHE